MSETGQKEVHGFQTEVKQLLQLMIHSLYSNKEIFLRELVSNAADAADKLRFKALSNADLYEGDGQLRVRVSANKENNTVTISDNGIGMTKEEIIEHLGTIAKSGTADFFSKLSGDQSTDSQLIGQFGVGFYSSFIVADNVRVETRAAGEKEAVCWESTGDGSFTIESIDKKDRGTTITLHLKDDAKEFAEDAEATLKDASEVTDDDMIFDIGPKSAQELAQIISKAGTIIWNGPVGVFEFDQFGDGTKTVAMAIADADGFSLAGGGDTIAAIQKYDIYDKVTYISTAGGAFLEYLEGKTLPAVAMLEDRAK